MAKRSLDTAISDLIQAIGLLVRRVRSAAIMSSNELSMTESLVLGRLEKEGPATTAELARAESMRPQSMGTVVAELEEQALIERSPHPSDGRQMILSITGKGAAVRASVRSAKHSWMMRAVAELSKEDQETLFAAGEILRRMVQK
ncbi:MarR family winged helix-turn-helix transcriptional regulator [Terracidiphilus gabretensis]|jgi:DNA-binding MarR family transcriptional regulator|uniref:MarR family winged helix-turn-helix transcriptional regulator n=1 Tax=Terracidiphilus gabretensis TaxID=1577687 RepID=UPI00071B5534|nr:MarR family transcriptional regulator [Terracidiphilus gabretensis]